MWGGLQERGFMLEEKPGKHDEEMLTEAQDNKAEAGPGAAKRPPHLRIKTPQNRLSQAGLHNPKPRRTEQ